MLRLCGIIFWKEKGAMIGIVGLQGIYEMGAGYWGYEQKTKYPQKFKFIRIKRC